MSFYWWIAFVDFFVLCIVSVEDSEMNSLFLFIFVSSSNFSAGIAGLRDGRSDVRIPRRARVPSFSHNRPAHWDSYSVCTEILSRGLNRPGREVEAEVKKWIYCTCPPTICLRGLNKNYCHLIKFWLSPLLIHLVTSCSDVQVCIINILNACGLHCRNFSMRWQKYKCGSDMLVTRHLV
jgi:hypothetical protein